MGHKEVVKKGSLRQSLEELGLFGLEIKCLLPCFAQNEIGKEKIKGFPTRGSFRFQQELLSFIAGVVVLIF